MTTQSPMTAEQALQLILDDLTDRSGLQQAWDEIDAEIKEEIKTVWHTAIGLYGDKRAAKAEAEVDRLRDALEAIHNRLLLASDYAEQAITAEADRG